MTENKEKTVEHEEPPFYSDIFSRKQGIFVGWQFWHFSEENLNRLAFEGAHEAEVDRWVKRDLKAIFDNLYTDEELDPRRFPTLYRKGIRYGEIRQTESLEDSLYFVLKGMLCCRGIREFDKDKYIRALTDWDNLFFPTASDKESELNKFKERVISILDKCFKIPRPKPRSYQSFIFAANFLFECLRCQCPESRENQFAIFSLLTFKSIFNRCFEMPFEYPILYNIAYEFSVLKDIAGKQRDIADGDFLDSLFKGIDSEFEFPDQEICARPDQYKVPDGYIEKLTKDFSLDKLHGIAKCLSDSCGDDCNGLIYTLLKQAAVGLIIAERSQEKEILTSLLEREINSPDSDLPLILYLIVSGLNSYSFANNCKNTTHANEVRKKRKKERSIKE